MTRFFKSLLFLAAVLVLASCQRSTLVDISSCPCYETHEYIVCPDTTYRHPAFYGQEDPDCRPDD